METLFINQSEVPDLLSVDECIDAMREALTDLARDQGLQPLRPVMWLPERVGALGMMPGYLGSIDTMGIKTVTVFPGNEGTEYDSHQGTVMLFDGRNGALKAVVDATEITAIRTAAVSAVATDLLAKEDASTLAILGAGVQGRSHLEAIPRVREITDVRIWSRNSANAEQLAETTDLKVEVASDVVSALDGADIVCTTTASSNPIVTGDMLQPGMHINAVGSSVPFARELDSAAMALSKIFVDRRESTVNESGDFLLARKEGTVSDVDLVAELGELLIGTHPGRVSEEEITLFDSLGLAVEDIAAANVIYRNAVERGVGYRTEFGGRRHG